MEEDKERKCPGLRNKPVEASISGTLQQFREVVHVKPTCFFSNTPYTHHTQNPGVSAALKILFICLFV